MKEEKNQCIRVSFEFNNIDEETASVFARWIEIAINLGIEEALEELKGE